MNKKQDKLIRRKKRIRAKIVGTAKRPRLSVARSLRGLQIQAIDDQAGRTLAGVNSEKLKGVVKKTKMEKASMAGKAIAKELMKLKIKSVVFDRGGRLYHGRIKVVAEVARKEGLKF